MKESKARVLVVDDYEPWLRFVSSDMQKHPEFLIVGEVSDGLEAVRKAQELQPDLILLDIGLPSLSGIQAARQIRELAPNSKILFITENRSREIAQEALRTGARGYLVKSDAARELMPAIQAVLQGDRFVSASLGALDFHDPSDGHSGNTSGEGVSTRPVQKMSAGRHQVALYSDDICLLENVTRFIGSALKAENAAVVVATEPHRRRLVQHLRDYGVDVDAATEQGRYIAMDAATLLSTFIVHGMLDQARFLKAWSNLILTASKASKVKHPRVAAYGAAAGLLWAQGNQEGALQIERLGNQLTKLYDVDILCSYSLGSVPGGMQSPAFHKICTCHSAAYSY